MNLTVLDYGAGNLKSITNMLDALECSYTVTSRKEDILNAEKLIFPGQGHFGQAMESLNSRGLTDSLIKVLQSGTPFLGICVGLQVLFDTSEEAPGIKGLGVFPGKNIKFIEGKVPQIGWNKLIPTENNNILDDDYVYFVNSFYVVPDNQEIVSAYCDYHTKFAASIEHKNITAMQFHPEKSGKAGYRYIKRWLEIHK